jgi:hypothetical protein
MSEQTTAVQLDQLDTFTRAYIEAMLWAETLHPFGICPVCGKDKILNRFNSSDDDTGNETRVCDQCGNIEPNEEPPVDENYGVEDIAPETLARIVADCEAFQAATGELITSDNLERHRGECTIDEMAGHDFWLTRRGHGCGFWDGDWEEPAATKLTESAHGFGDLDIYVGEDGKLYF